MVLLFVAIATDGADNGEGGLWQQVAMWPRWRQWEAKDIPHVDVKTNSFNTAMIHGCRNGFVCKRRPTNYMADKT